MATQAEMQLYAAAAGLPDPALMAAIGMAESGGRATVVNSIGCVGLWQINQPVWMKQHPSWTVAWLKVPLNNARAAKVVYDAQGLTAWEAYTNGSYQKFYHGSSTASAEPTTQLASYTAPDGTQIDLTQPPPGYTQAGWKDLLRVLPPYELYKLYKGDPVPDLPNSIGGVDLSGLNAVGAGVEASANWLANPRNWIRVAYVVVGAAVAIVGLSHIIPLSGVLNALPEGRIVKAAGKVIK